MACILTPAWIPGLRIKLIAERTAQVSENVEVMHCALDHQRVGYFVAEFAPTGEFARIGGEATGEIVEGSIRAGTKHLAQGGLILVKTVTHGHRHLLSRAAHFVRN